MNAIYKEEAHDRLWIGTRNGFSCYDLARRTYRNYLSPAQPSHTAGTDVLALAQTADGTLWVGTINQGLWQLRRPGTAREQLVPCTRPAGVPQGSVESLAEDRYGTVWAASLAQGLRRYGPDGRAELPTDQSMFLLYDRPHDVLWASTRDAGLLKLRVLPDSLVLLRQFVANPNGVDGLSVSYTWPLLLDRAGTLWIGTIGGGPHRSAATATPAEA
ncbi:ligand-binding sensor domain-containing protein [Hymenobacter sp. PAMC 26628]|uniref:ligand-binding sensor domain-containing protein n=1 Tax=Hymenobacter sp. PAMC 26628 TaxID=1484118 RepID=UPI00138F1C6D|nr:two-component regulator propeller domain-containing protein [Hymenobacter sp. PAMC 26628]